MQAFIDQLIRERAGVDPAAWPYTQYVYIAAMFTAGMVMTTFAAVFSGILSWYERKIAARMQSRVGPNRVGPHGFLQWVADAVKLLSKEDLIPTEADRTLFRAAPYLIVTGLVLTFVALPFSHRLIVADMNVGIFYIMSITALVVVGILMSGWSSNSKWALFGGMRSAAQVISYEIPAGLAMMIPVMMTGSLSVQDIIRGQGGIQDGGALWQVGGWPWNWYVFANPMAFLAFVIFFTSSLAEGNRTPFDLPEAESELVAGYFTEYSGMRFSYFFLTEWANVWVMSALSVTLFLGGWQIPGISLQSLDNSGIALELVSFAIFALKTLVLVNVVVWLRWTLPRIRVDQMMSLCWKYFVPAGMVSLVLVAATEWLMAGVSADVVSILHFGFFVLAGLVPLIAFTKQTFKNLRIVGEHVDVGGW